MQSGKLLARDEVLATALYADIFDYPLTRAELMHWVLMTPHRTWHVPELKDKNGYLVLKGRENLVTVRKERAGWQEGKWRIARRASGWLSWIPSVDLVGVTGGL